MKNKKIILILVSLILITLIIVSSYKIFEQINLKEENKDDEKIKIENIEANLTDAYIYGTHLNIEGSINIIDNNIRKLTLILENEEEKIEYNLNYEIEENIIKFTTCEYINRGINLEEIKKEKYTFLIKLTEKSGKDKYYTINVNDVKIEELEYYTISNNNRTNFINLKNVLNEGKSYLNIYLENIEMPENIYDITLDAGHGGESPGATYKGYKESDIVLDYTLKLKDELEKRGLKILLTRSEDVLTEEYGENGRAVLPNKVKSKYTFSIHLNSNTEVRSGVEIYAPAKAELSFAKLLAENIVEYADTKYSENEIDKVYDGVYVRIFTKEDIEESDKSAKEDGYDSYNIKENTPYLFMIRETGGKITNAYVDGRNKEYKTNLYYNSSMGNESYLLELGYINSDKDLNNLLKNKDGYVKGMAQSILSLVNKI